MATPVPLALNYAMGRASVASGGRLVNMYPQKAQVGAKADMALIGAPGARNFVTLTYLNDMNRPAPEGDVLALAYSNRDDKLIAISEHGVYTVDREGTVVTLGPSALRAPVSIASNGTDFLAVDGTLEHAIWINSDAVTPVYPTAENFFPADSVTVLDGFLILNRKDNGQVFCSGIRNRLFNGLDFAEAEKAPDDTVGVLASGDNLFIFGEETTEIWYNAGLAIGFPFARVAGGTIEQGCAAIATARQIDGMVFWLTSAGTVWMASGMSPSRISDDEIESVIKEHEADWASAHAYCYTDEGHTFYVLTVGDVTFAYDLSTGFWCQRSNYSRGHALGQCYARAWGKHFVGTNDGRVVEMSLDAYDDAGEPLIAEIVSMPLHNQRDYLSIGGVELQMDVGLSPLGGDYVVLLSVSGDGGKTWGPNRAESIGRTGEYRRRVVWRKYGAKRDWRFRFTIADPFRRALLAQMHLVM